MQAYIFVFASEKRNQLESSLRGTIKWCLQEEGKYDELGNVDNLKGEDLYQEADKVFNSYWTAHRLEGATCDFGGLGILQEMNKTDSDYMDDDFFYYREGTPDVTGMILKLFWTLIGGLAAGGLLGFFIAMRLNKKFNAKITKTLSKSSLGSKLKNSRVFSSTFHPIDMADYSQIPSEIPAAEFESVNPPIRYN